MLLTITFRIMIVLCNFTTVQFLFKSQHAELLIANRWPCLLFLFLKKSSPLVIFLVKV